MFNQQDQTKKTIETVIGPSVTLEGNFNGSGNVFIEGKVHGTLSTSGNIRIGDQAKIKADVKGADIYIAGEVHGNIQAKERLELSATAKVFGNIESKILHIEAGAFFSGKSNMGGEQHERDAMPIQQKQKTTFAKK